MRIIQPLNGYILIRPRKTATPAGIDIPDSVDKEKATVGTVVIGGNVFGFNAQGSNFNQIVGVSVGDTVLFSAIAPRKVEHEGEECLLVNGEDIYAVIEA